MFEQYFDLKTARLAHGLESVVELRGRHGDDDVAGLGLLRL